MIEITYIRTSMLLLRWDGLNILTDPWFAMQMRGLPVFVWPCIKVGELPPLDLVLVSHLHPDHFDKRAMSKLKNPCRLLIGPPGVETKRIKPTCEKIIVLTDGQKETSTDFVVTAFSVRHSGYENAYLIERNGMSVLFAGDARYTEVFAEIGKKHQPTVSLLPVGGTEIMGRRIVMDPADALLAGRDLGTKVIVPIHHGGEWMSVPPLSRHPGRADTLVKLVEKGNAPLTVCALMPGQRAQIDPAGQVSRAY